MKKFLLSATLVILVLTLVCALASCNNDGGSSLISTAPPETTATPETTVPVTEHVHSYTSTVTPPTCTAEGYTTYTCECGDTYKGDTTAMLAHTFGDWKTTTAATCTVAGEQTRTCSVCGATEKQSIAKSAHYYVDTVTAPTKTAQGYTTHVCAVCKDSYVDSYTNPTGSTGLTYATNTDGSLTITGAGTCTDSELIIYSTNAAGKSVTAIAANAFAGNTYIKTVLIPASVNSIGEGAFAGCTSLTAFTVETDNKNYSTSGGMLCSKDGKTIVCYPAGLTLSSCTIPANVTSIVPSAFAGCKSLEKFILGSNTSFVVIDDVLYDKDKKTLIAFPAGKSAILFAIPETVDTISSYAFYNAQKLGGVKLPARVLNADMTVKVSGITTIGDYAFAGCTEISSIVFPDITSKIGNYAFADCTKLDSISIGASMTTISKYCFANCTALTNMVIPSTVVTIDDGAFNGCTGMTTLLIGSGVKTIGAKAFTGCLNKGQDSLGNNIGKVFYEGNSDKWLGPQLAVDSTNTMYLTVYPTIYFYSETAVSAGNAWHYNTLGEAVIW